MSEQQSPPFRRRRLGRTLRDLRESARVSPAEVCTRLEFSPARLSRMENGQTAPDIVIVKSLLDEYGIPVNDWEPYLDLAREAKQKGWWQAHGLPAMGYVALEAAASSVRTFTLAHVHGLLQTEDYARAVFEQSLLRRSARLLDSEIEVRLIRQRRLTAPDGDLQLDVVADEGVLRRPIGGHTVMRAQLRRIVEFAGLPTVELRVLPTAIGAHLGMASAFTVLRFPDPEDSDIAYLEHVAGSLQMEKEDEVRACKLAFERLREQSLDPDESTAFIEQVMREL